MNVVLPEPWTVERFLAWEDKQEGRHEFDGTQILDITGGSRGHQRIVSNLIRLLEDMLDPSRFDAVLEMRVQIGKEVRYPDVSVVAGPVANTVRTLHDAIVLFEVISPDSAALDRTDKRTVYARLDSIRHYIILEQDRLAATILSRAGDGWLEREAEAELPLPELGVTLPLAAVYRGIRSGLTDYA